MKDSKSYWKIDELVKEILNIKFELEYFLKIFDGSLYYGPRSPTKVFLIISDWIVSYAIDYIYKDHILHAKTNFPKAYKKN